METIHSRHQAAESVVGAYRYGNSEVVVNVDLLVAKSVHCLDEEACGLHPGRGVHSAVFVEQPDAVLACILIAGLWALEIVSGVLCLAKAVHCWRSGKPQLFRDLHPISQAQTLQVMKGLKTQLSTFMGTVRGMGWVLPAPAERAQWRQS
eukprot:scaffold150916_cov41-Prasinocladus_malaysianus.AAC.1